MNQFLKSLFIIFIFISGSSKLTGQISNAQIFYDEFIEPRFNRALIEGKTHSLLGNYDTALVSFSDALKLKPESGAINYELSRILLRMNNLREAGIYGRKAFLSDEQNKWYILNLAEIYQGLQKNDSAIFLMDKLIKIEPQNPEYKYVMAGLLESKGQFERALEYLDDVEEEIGIVREIVLEKYRIYLKLNKGEEALSVLKLASDYLTDDYAINGIVAEYYNTTGNIDSAWFYYRRIVPASIDLPDVAISYGNFLLENDMSDSATIVLGRLISNNSTPRELVGDILRQFIGEETDEKYGRVAESLAEIAYERFSDDVNIVSLYADIQNSRGNLSNLEKALKNIIKQDPQNYLAWEQMLYVQSSLERTDSIIKYGERAVLFFKDRPVPFYFLGVAHYMKKDYESALRYLENGIRIADEPGLKFQFYSMIADCYYQRGEYNKSWSSFENALFIDPENPLINNNYAYYLAEMNENLDKALKMIETALKNDNSRSITFIDTYAWVLHRRGETKTAKEILRKVVKTVEGRDPEIFEHYGDILFSLGKSRKAVKFWIRALEMGGENSPGLSKKISETAGND